MTIHPPIAYRMCASLIAFVTAAALFIFGSTADAAIVATVPLGTASNFSVLAASTVTNTGDSVLHNSLGLWDGTAITGFPPGEVIFPATIEQTTAAAQQAQLDLDIAYLNAANRPTDVTFLDGDLTGRTLVGGVYSGPDKSPLGLAGELILDGENNPNTVFIFQTNSTLTTGTGSNVTLINGAQECNVFWQVGSSATIGTDSDFTGNILALTSITVTTGATIHGRALASNAAVTLDANLFTDPTCATALPEPPTTTSTTVAPTTTSTTVASTTTTTAVPATTTTVVAAAPLATTTTAPAALAPPSTGSPQAPSSPSGGPDVPVVFDSPPADAVSPPSSGGPDIPRVVGPPQTGAAPLREHLPWPLWLLVISLCAVGTVGMISSWRIHSHGSVSSKR